MAAGGSPTTIGRPCEQDTDCEPGVRCIRAIDNMPGWPVGGPANGYCSPNCVRDEDCGPNASCVATESGGVCLLPCTPGQPQLTELNQLLDPNKCLGREDLACDGVGPRFGILPELPFCNPTCSSHAQCPTGRQCAFGIGKCVDMPITGSPSGTACDPMAPDCEGICMNAGGVSFCTRLCVLGGVEFRHECDGFTAGLCNIRLGSVPLGAGDLGACMTPCSAHSDCINPNLWCANFGTGTGYCFASIACPSGQATCDAAFPGFGLVCTDTLYGPYCVNPSYPLGDAAPSGAGGGAGAGGA